MNLTKITQQGRLLYFNQSADSISIYENDYYRWLMFDDIFQSLMLKSRPQKLILPHQYILMLPLIFFCPKNICEFGLGGGNIGRFLTTLTEQINFTSVEKSTQVIECFNEFFNPDDKVAQLINNDAENALFDKRLRRADWYIYDIYQHNNEATNAQLLKSKLLSKAITDDTWLSLNLPDPTEPELVYLIEQLRPVFTEHTMVFFKVPNFLNVIIHFVPKKLYVTQADNQQRLEPYPQSYLPDYLLNRGANYWSTMNVTA